MTSDWKQDYSNLTDFVSAHPEIKISADKISIPGNVREQFYALFNNVRTAIVRDKISGSLGEVRKLIESYRNAEQAASSLLKLESVASQTDLQRFLDDPDDWLSRELYEPLFNLLKGTINAQQLENIGAGIVDVRVPAIYERAYGKWIALSLLKLLEADDLQTIPLPVLHPRERAAVGGKGTMETIRLPQKSNRITFAHALFQLFTVPDYIAHSPRLDKYFSIRTQYEDSLAEADSVAPAKEWYPVNVMGNITSGMMLIHVADNPIDIAVVADRVKICRPDMIIECRTQKNWYTQEGMSNIIMHHHGLNPVLGTFVASAMPVALPIADEIKNSFRIITPGVEEKGLMPIIDKLLTAASVRQNAGDGITA